MNLLEEVGAGGAMEARDWSTERVTYQDVHIIKDDGVVGMEHKQSQVEKSQ